MFTGLIQAIGKVVKYDGKRLWIASPIKGLAISESVSVDGVCLTVCARRQNFLAFDVGIQTQRVTTLGSLRAGSRVNLERALRVGDHLGGHWVSGHVEQTGQIVRVEKGRKSWWFTFQIPRDMCRYVVSRGSVAIDGISLTSAIVKGNRVKIMIIPHTLTHTTLGEKRAGDRVNLEPDMLAKYARDPRRFGAAVRSFVRFLKRAEVATRRGDSPVVWRAPRRRS
jgi:riboflavin synthase